MASTTVVAATTQHSQCQLSRGWFFRKWILVSSSLSFLPLSYPNADILEAELCLLW